MLPLGARVTFVTARAPRLPAMFETTDDEYRGFPEDRPGPVNRKTDTLGK